MAETMTAREWRNVLSSSPDTPCGGIPGSSESSAVGAAGTAGERGHEGEDHEKGALGVVELGQDTHRSFMRSGSGTGFGVGFCGGREPHAVQSALGAGTGPRDREEGERGGRSAVPLPSPVRQRAGGGRRGPVGRAWAARAPTTERAARTGAALSAAVRAVWTAVRPTAPHARRRCPSHHPPTGDAPGGRGAGFWHVGHQENKLACR